MRTGIFKDPATGEVYAAQTDLPYPQPCEEIDPKWFVEQLKRARKLLDPEWMDDCDIGWCARRNAFLEATKTLDDCR